jgi:hypothetical protein
MQLKLDMEEDLLGGMLILLEAEQKAEGMH